MPLPDLDLATPEDRFWYRLTYKPREWIWERGFGLAINPALNAEVDIRKEVLIAVDTYRKGGYSEPAQEHVDAFVAWAASVYNDQVHSQDGKEYMHWLVESLKPVLPNFFAPDASCDQQAALVNYKAMPLMTRHLAAFRGQSPVRGTITVVQIPGAPPDRNRTMMVHPVDEMGALLP